MRLRREVERLEKIEVAARLLVENDEKLSPWMANRFDEVVCSVCGESDHTDDCQWLALERAVKATSN